MILITHIIIGVISVIIGGFALARRNQSLLQLQLASFGLTLASGVVLLALNPAALTHLCVSGVVFSCLTMAMALATRRRISQLA